MFSNMSEEIKWPEIDAHVNCQYHECSQIDVDKMPPHYFRYQIRLIDDPNDVNGPIHWWSLFDGGSDHHILCCPYCGCSLQ